jgi:hypothetical protein
VIVKVKAGKEIGHVLFKGFGWKLGFDWKLSE